MTMRRKDALAVETKDFPLDIKAISDDGVIEGYASVFGNVDHGGDKVMPGAYVESLTRARREGRTIKMLWNHDPSQPIGIWEDLAEDAKGLWGKGRLVLDVARAREIHALAKAGAVQGLSIGYRTLKSTPEGNVRLLEKLELYEVSPVTFPMNDLARMTTVKAEDEDYNDADARFVRRMIPHHEMAVTMARAVLRDGRNVQVEKLARAIIAAQTEEIATLRAWLEDRDLAKPGGMGGMKGGDEADLMNRLRAGDRLTEREFETVLKGALGFSNSEAERAARVLLKGPGEPADAAKEAAEFYRALLGA